MRKWQWTVTREMISDCKRELPPVRVELMGKMHWARTSGRLNKFCTVSVTNAEGLYSQAPLWWDAQFSWQSVCRAVVSGVPLKT